MIRVRKTAQSLPASTGTAVTFTVHNFSRSSFSPWCFSNFSCCFFLVAVVWLCAVYHNSFLPLFVHHRYVQPLPACHSVSGSAMGSRPVHFQAPLEVFPILSSGLPVHTRHRCFCILRQPLCCVVSCTPCLLICYNLLLCAGFSHQHLCIACTWGLQALASNDIYLHTHACTQLYRLEILSHKYKNMQKFCSLFFS